MLNRKCSMAILATGFALSTAMGNVLARDFTIASWGGAYQDNHRENFFKPLGEKLNIEVLENVYQGGWAQFKAIQETGVLPFDVVQVERAEVIRGCEEGLFLPIEWSRIEVKDDLVENAATECGLGVVTVGIIMAYNADTLNPAPTSTADFYDLEKFPGKRGMRKFPKINIEMALMADGVAPDDIYTVLNEEGGLARAFAKLDTIKSEIQWWEGGAQAPEWLSNNEVVMSTAYSGRILSAQREGRNLKIIWPHTAYDMDSWVILKDSPYHDYAYEFLNIFSDPQRQAKFVEGLPYAPTNAKTRDFLDAATLASLPIGENIADALFIGTPESNEYWLNNLDEVLERFNAWAAAE